jgi:hypothetical protein
MKNATTGGMFSNRWDKFGDALRREDKIVLDETFKAPDIHRGAIEAFQRNESGEI